MLALRKKKESFEEDTGRRVLEIPLSKVRPNPYQPRKHFEKEALWELAESIKEVGVLQPISVRKMSDYYELVAGERRLRAAMLADLPTIPAILVEAGDNQSALLALVENLQRQNLHYLEEAEGYQTMMQDYGLTQEELAKRLGKKQSTVANKVRLLKLPPEVKKGLYENALTERHARALLKIPDPEVQTAVLSTVITKELNVRATENLVERVLEDMRQKPKPEQKEIFAFCDIRLLTNTIRQSLSLMEKAGVSATYQEEEGDSAYRIVIEIPK